MPDVFISHSSADVRVAHWLSRSCENSGIDAFVASISLRGGDRWKEEILEKLDESQWFFFLATPHSIASDACKHEIGAALIRKKTIVPLLWGVHFSDLPSWISDRHGIDLRDRDAAQFRRLIRSIARKEQLKAFAIGMIVGALLAGAALAITHARKGKTIAGRLQPVKRLTPPLTAHTGRGRLVK